MENGTFQFKGKISEPIMAYLTANAGSYELKADDDPNTISIFLEPGNITAKGKYGYLNELKISGSKTQIEYEKLLKEGDPYKAFGSEYVDFVRRYIATHPTSYISAAELNLYISAWPVD